MNIEVISFILRPCKTRIASVSVKYHDLILKCELAYYPPEKKAWIRMPEKWFKVDKKTSYVYWPIREISDVFQKEVLKLIFDKYDLDIQKIAKMHLDAYEKRGKTKIHGLN